MPYLCLIFILLFARAGWAQSSTPEPEVDSKVLTELGDEYQNSIRLLQNRFRIDYEVDEITMVFFRRYGSAPVVLVRPDGSKIFQSQADGERIAWFDSTTYDMITIKNPVPGPWQAVGQILPESRVMVISDIKLHAQPLPDVIFSGEILKQTAYLTNGDKPIDYSEFRDVVTLEIKFVSTNNPNYANFGANDQLIASFEDDGRGMDERPMDGIFTGQFNLSVPPGEWKPVFVVSTPMFSREQVNKTLMLAANPIIVSHELDGGGGGYHKLMIDANREYVDISTLLLDGKIRFPNGDVQNFSLTQQSDAIREHLIVNYEYGIYRVKLTAYGNTVSGRDFILDVPEYSFLVEQPPSDSEITPEAEKPQQIEGSEPQTEPETTQPKVEEVVVEEPSYWGWILGVNLVLLLVGGALIVFLLRDKKPKNSVAQEPQSTKEKSEPEFNMPDEKVSLLSKLKSLFGIFTKKNNSSDQAST